MTKSKPYKSAAAIALALLMTLVLVLGSACSCRGFDRAIFDYDAIVFEEVGENELANAIAEAESRIGSSSIAVQGGISKVQDVLYKIMYNEQYAYTQYLKDTTGTYKDIYLKYDAMLTSAFSEYYDLLYTVLQSHESMFSDEDKAMIISNHQTMDEEYVALQADITSLIADYDSLDSSLSAEAFATAAAEIYAPLVQKNIALAQKANAESYEQYAYADYGRTYDAESAEKMCSYVKEYIGPLLPIARQAVDDASAKLGITDVSALNYATRGEDETARNMSAVKAHAAEMGSYMSEALDYMDECNLHYKATAEKNPNGTQGAATVWLGKYNAPYVYQYCSGGYSDLMTFVHEFGHFTAFYNIGSGASADLDIAEIHSQGNEMLFTPRLYEIYGANVGDYLVKSQLFDQLYWAITMGCLFDEFQREVFSAPEVYADADALNTLFEQLIIEYNADDYGDQISERAGYDFNKYWWAKVPHTFRSPFYYISYAVSALPAMTIYEDSLTVSREAAIAEYYSLQHYGDGSSNFEDVLANAKIASPFNRTTVRDLASFLKNQF